MSAGDGNLLGKDAAGANKIVSGTRWQEISADIGIVADMSHDIGARTEFLPLNGALRPLTIQGTNEGDVAAWQPSSRGQATRRHWPLLQRASTSPYCQSSRH